MSDRRKGRLEGKVAFVTGAARGQGRSHAVRMAEQGADIIAIDLCGDIETTQYRLGTTEDLAQTVKEVEALGRRIIAHQADVRERAQLRTVLDEAVGELGRLDVVVANAGISPLGSPGHQPFVDALDVDFVGVHSTVAVSLPHLGSGASIVITGSTAGLVRYSVSNPALGSGGAGYELAKRLLTGYTDQLALQLAPQMIRVNIIHPTSCNTPLFHQPAIYQVFRPDLENPTASDCEAAFATFQAMPVPYVEPNDVSQLVIFLASDESRYVTGQQIRVDAGTLLKEPPQ